MKVLAIDVGGSHVKLLVSGAKERRRFDSGAKLTPRQMVAQVKELTADWPFEAVSIGYPGLVIGRAGAGPEASCEQRGALATGGRVPLGCGYGSSTSSRCGGP